MTTTPNPTAESIIAEAMVNAGAPLMHSRVEEAVANALRAHNLLSEGAPVQGNAKLLQNSLDPERVAEALCRGIHPTRFQYRSTRFACEDCSKGSDALCEAYTEGKLT